MGTLSIVWYVGLTLVSENILFDSIAALGLMIAFYYGITGFACVIYYRRELTNSVKNFVFVGVAPLIGGARAAVAVLRVLHRPLEAGELRVGRLVARASGRRSSSASASCSSGVVLMLLWRGGHPRLLPPQARDRRPRLARGPAAGASGGDRGDRLMAAPIVVGYDGTPGARAAGGEALRLARDLGGELVFGYCYYGERHGRRGWRPREGAARAGDAPCSTRRWPRPTPPASRRAPRSSTTSRAPGSSSWPTRTTRA